MKLAIILTNPDDKPQEVLKFDTETLKVDIDYPKLELICSMGQFLEALARMFLWTKDTIAHDTVKRKAAEGNRTEENAEASEETGTKGETRENKGDPTEGHSVDKDFVR